MVQEALKAGFYEPEYFGRKKFPRLQIITIEELFAGKRPEYPPQLVDTYQKAEKQRKKPTQKKLV